MSLSSPLQSAHITRIVSKRKRCEAITRGCVPAFASSSIHWPLLPFWTQAPSEPGQAHLGSISIPQGGAIGHWGAVLVGPECFWGVYCVFCLFVDTADVMSLQRHIFLSFTYKGESPVAVSCSSNSELLKILFVSFHSTEIWSSRSC